jgi:outer membrane protein TolC
MLTLIKLSQMLTRRIDSWQTHSDEASSSPHSRSQVKPSILQERGSANEDRAAMRLKSVCAIIALSMGGVGHVAAASSTSLDLAGIRQSLQTSANQANLDLRHTPGQLPISSNKLAQNTPPTAPTPPIPNNGSKIKLPNELILPNTGGQVQITGQQAITLPQAVDIAFRNNRQIQAARLIVNRAQTGVREAQSAQALQVGLTGGLQNQGSPLIIGTQSQFGSTTGTDAQGALQATYNILSAGRNQSSVRAAEEQVLFDRLDLLRVEQLIRGQVLTAYYDLQAADSSVIINQAAVADATRSLSDAQLQERAGVGTKFDILRAQVQLATANQDLTNARSQQQTARKKIAQLLVVDNNTEFTAADPVGESGTWNYSLEDSVVIAFRNRPEAKQELVRRNISEQQQVVASAADSAQVDLVASYGLGKSISSNTSAQDNYSLGARLRWDFWDGGAAGARASRERFSQEISENQFTTARNQIRFEVEQAYSSLGSSRTNIATATQALKQAEESLKLARLRFQAGVGTQTDVIQAQTELARARGNRITAILNYNRAISSLRTATVINE